MEVECADRDAAKVWIIRHQLGRRNITLAARCELAEVLAAAFTAQAKANMAAGGKLGGESKAKGSSKLTTPIEDARKLAAKEAGVSTGTMSAYKAGGALPQKSAEPVETRRELAAVAGVSHDTIAKAKVTP